MTVSVLMLVNLYLNWPAIFWFEVIEVNTEIRQAFINFKRISGVHKDIKKNIDNAFTFWSNNHNKGLNKQFGGKKSIKLNY